MEKSNTLTKKQAIDKLWRLGNLEWKLRGIQKEMRKAIIDNPNERTVFLVSRRSGKSFVLCAVGTEVCIKKPNSIVKYVCPKQKMVKTIVRPIMRAILEDCPPDLVPEYKEADKVYRFPNGSEIQFAGSDSGNIENLRGGYADLCLVDEAGFVDDLDYSVKSVLSPTTKTVSGKIVLASTPSREPDHEFMTEFVAPADAEGTLIKYTIYDNPMFTEEIIRQTINEYPQGDRDPQFRREYLCESAIDSDIMVIPEYNTELERDIVKQVEMPSFFDAYVSGDPAVRDLTVVLFGYYDFLNSQLIILDELVLGGQKMDLTTQDIVDGIKRKEKLLYTNKLTGEVKEPFMRIMDNNNLFLLNDLYQEHGLKFYPTQKDNKEAQVNKLRLWIKQGKIIIHPQCKNLRYHLKMARWKTDRNGNRKGFQHVKASSNGELRANHCDAVDALLYMVRNIDINRNPYPNDYFDLKGDSIFVPSNIKDKERSLAKDIMYGICNYKKSNKG
jgi:PBSX family phage terminase large subunit